MVGLPESSNENPESGNDQGKPVHPGFGFMKGILIVARDADLTAPACPEWGSYAEQKYGPKSELGKAAGSRLEACRPGRRRVAGPRKWRYPWKP